MMVKQEAEFDTYAETYDAALEQAISVSGEDKNYFAHGRIAWLADYLRKRNHAVKSVMDYGCGVGSAAPHLREFFADATVLGVDVSAKSINVARRENESPSTQFHLFDEHQPHNELDLAYSANVFHHIPLAERDAAVNYIFRALRPGGIFSIWEQNAWNPATRYVMSRCTFDEDAITLTPPETRRLLQHNGFEIISTEFLFIFPRQLQMFRFLEPHLACLPFGAQYQTLCRKPLKSSDE
ncbi:MAG: class I SAM-dependent methyltransferase [Pyrinomonadaceae bacterium]